MLDAVALPADGAGGPFDLINGLPMHPLVVHAAVVLIPLSALGLVLMVFWPSFSRRLGWLVALGSAAAAGSAAVAKLSGEALAERVGEPGFDHADLGEVLPLFAFALLVGAVGLWLIDRTAPADGPAPRRRLRIAVAVVALVVALANLVWVYRVGDSGAKSVWTGRVAASMASGGSTDSGSDDSEDPEDALEAKENAEDDGDDGDGSGEDGSVDGTAAVAGTYTLAQVAERNTAADCWAAIDGVVYDLTMWVARHPGGAQRIIDVCGTDATDAFSGQHGGESAPEEQLAQFRIGRLQ